MYLKIDSGFHYAVFCFRMELRDRKVLLLCNASHHISEQMMTVDATDADTDREKKLFILLEVHCHYSFALLGSLTDSGEAVALVECDLSLSVLETYNFVSRQRMSASATLVFHLGTVCKETAQTALCLIGQHMVLPVCLWHGIINSAYLYTVATVEHSLY